MRLLNLILLVAVAVILCLAQPNSQQKGTTQPRPPCNAQNVGMKWPTQNPTHVCQKIGTDSFNWGVIGRSGKYGKVLEQKNTTPPNTR